MVKKLVFLSLLQVLCVLQTRSQELSHQVIVPAAGIIQTADLEYTQTTGEAVTETISAPEGILTQGFQQPRFIISPDNQHEGNGINVYPNPVKDRVYVEVFGDSIRSFRIEILDISGARLMTDHQEFRGSFRQTLSYPLGKFSSGIYFIRISSNDGIINRTFKINKL